jgi:uncharacterized protein (TIGR02001 family)
MIKSRVYLAGLALAVAAAAAHAGVSVTPAITSDYDFRGYTQSGKDPAVSVSVDYSDGPIHVGAWTSNVNFGTGDAKSELDLLVDYSFGSDEFAKFNTGIVYYTYPGHDVWTYPEAWISASKGWFQVAYHYSWAWSGTTQEASYVEGNVTVPIADTGFGVVGHVGYSFGQYWSAVGDAFADTGDYTDYSIAVTKSFGNFAFNLKYTDSNGVDFSTDSGPYKDIFSNDGRVILSVSTTLPWAKE